MLQGVSVPSGIGETMIRQEGYIGNVIEEQTQLQGFSPIG